MISSLFSFLFSILFPQRKPTTKVILLLNSDVVRPIQTPERDSLQLTTAPPDELQHGNIAVEIARQFPETSIISHVDHNLLSFLMNVLIKNKVSSVVMVKKTDLQREYHEKEDIFTYKLSRAEREHLEKI
jgi:hypothetical protein